MSDQKDVIICWIDDFKTYAQQEGWDFPFNATGNTTQDRKKHYHEALRQFSNSRKGKRYFA